MYISETSNHRVRKVTVSTGIITTIAGTGTNGFFGDNGPATSSIVNDPDDVAVDSAGIFSYMDLLVFLVRLTSIFTL